MRDSNLLVQLNTFAFKRISSRSIVDTTVFVWVCRRVENVSSFYRFVKTLDFDLGLESWLSSQEVLFLSFFYKQWKRDLKNMSQTHYFHCKHSVLFPSTAVAFGWVCPRPFSGEGFSREELCLDFIAALLTAIPTRVWMFMQTVA